MTKVGLIVGHSPRRQGASNSALGIGEYKFNDILVSRIYERLLDSGIDAVIIHRDTYSGLPDKVNAEGVDFSLAFHCNAFDTRASGSETLYHYSSKRSLALAITVNDRVVDALGLPDRGVKALRDINRGYYLLWRTVSPCVICEPFFIDNNQDLGVATYNYEKLVDAYVYGILDYIEGS